MKRMRSQFRVLFRQFLFRIVDESALSPSAGGDSAKLLSQYAGILFYISMLAGVVGLLMAGRTYPLGTGLVMARILEHFFISTTMLLAGLFAVFSWDACFPDHRDVLVLVPLPVAPWTIVSAKVAAVTSSLALMVGALHCVAGLVWPAAFTLAASPGAGILEVARGYAAYSITITASAIFVLASLLFIQGSLGLLPRPLALRLSPLLQICAFSALLAGYFMEGHTLPLHSSPTYWFLGLFEWVAGRGTAASDSLANRALISLTCSCGGAALCFAISYLRTMRMIVEQPSLAPRAHGRFALPTFGRPQVAALAHFQLRTLGRSRQQRFLLALFVGLAFAILTLFVKTPVVQQDLRSASPWMQPNAPLIVASVVTLFLAVAGCRVAFSMPADLKANWIFRLLPCEQTPCYTTATRWTLILFAAVPALLVWGALLAWLWPSGQALGHLLVLAALAAVLVEGAVVHFHKIPFTCSYLPGKANVYYYFFAFTLLVLNALLAVARQELAALQHPWMIRSVAAALIAIALVVHRYNVLDMRSAKMRYEEIAVPAITELSLSIDGTYGSR